MGLPADDSTPRHGLYVFGMKTGKRRGTSSRSAERYACALGAKCTRYIQQIVCFAFESFEFALKLLRVLRLLCIYVSAFHVSRITAHGVRVTMPAPLRRCGNVYIFLLALVGLPALWFVLCRVIMIIFWYMKIKYQYIFCCCFFAQR